MNKIKYPRQKAKVVTNGTTPGYTGVVPNGI